MALCCDRCEAAVGIGHDETGNDTRLQEMTMGFGILTILCVDCRRAWMAYSYDHDLFKKYSEAGFRFRMWQLKWRKDPFKCDVEDGVKLLQALEAVEPELHKLTYTWIRAGISASERRSREARVKD